MLVLVLETVGGCGGGDNEDAGVSFLDAPYSTIKQVTKSRVAGNDCRAGI